MSEIIEHSQQNSSVYLMKYAVLLPLPDVLSNRPIEDLLKRPNLVKILNDLVWDLEHWCYHNCDKNFVIGSDEITHQGIELHFESQQDKIKFIDQWPYQHQKVKIKRPKYAVTWLHSVEA